MKSTRESSYREEGRRKMGEAPCHGEPCRKMKKTRRGGVKGHSHMITAVRGRRLAEKHIALLGSVSVILARREGV